MCGNGLRRDALLELQSSGEADGLEVPPGLTLSSAPPRCGGVPRTGARNCHDGGSSARLLTVWALFQMAPSPILHPLDCAASHRVLQVRMCTWGRSDQAQAPPLPARCASTAPPPRWARVPRGQVGDDERRHMPLCGTRQVAHEYCVARAPHGELARHMHLTRTNSTLIGWAGEASRKSSMASEASLGQPPSRAVSIPVCEGGGGHE